MYSSIKTVKNYKIKTFSISFIKNNNKKKKQIKAPCSSTKNGCERRAGTVAGDSGRCPEVGEGEGERGGLEFYDASR